MSRKLSMGWAVLAGVVVATAPARAQTSGPETPPAAEESEAGPEGEDRPASPLEFEWDAGLHIHGKWDYLHVKIGGDVQNDTAGFVNTDSAEEILGTPIDDGVEWRRARVYAQGMLFRHLDFKLRFDLTADNPPSVQDAYFSLVNLPIPTAGFTFGRFRAPLGLDGYTAADDTVFMERSLMSEAFLPSRNTGLMLHGHLPNRRIRWSVAALQPQANAIDLSDTDNLGWSARFAWAFTVGKKKRTLVHLGTDFWRRNVDTTIEYATRPESHIAPFFVDTGDVTADSSDITVFEGAVQRGRWKVMGEYAFTKVKNDDRQDSLTFHGFYVQGSTFLTGETAPYRSARGTFTRPHPRRSFRKGGLGALELGLRFSRIDLTDNAIQGGILSNWSAAFNWHLTYHTKFMFNAILATLKGADPVGIFQMRLQVAF